MAAGSSSLDVHDHYNLSPTTTFSGLCQHRLPHQVAQPRNLCCLWCLQTAPTPPLKLCRMVCRGRGAERNFPSYVGSKRRGGKVVEISRALKVLCAWIEWRWSICPLCCCAVGGSGIASRTVAPPLAGGGRWTRPPLWGRARAGR